MATPNGRGGWDLTDDDVAEVLARSEGHVDEVRVMSGGRVYDTPEKDYDAPAEDDAEVEALADRIWDREPWQFVRLVRQPTGWGVAVLTARHRDKGSVVVHLTRQDLRALAIAALEAMEPD